MRVTKTKKGHALTSARRLRSKELEALSSTNKLKKPSKKNLILEQKPVQNKLLTNMLKNNKQNIK